MQNQRGALAHVRGGHGAIVGMAALLCLAAAMAWRITRGLDLSDEAYYAIFIYDWLKGGVRTSTLMTLHQTAALLVYPAARVYAALVGGDSGLVLFLRTLFLAGNLAAALCWLCFFRRAGLGPVGWIAAAFSLAFTPFDLPAPSYNTLGLQGLEIGLAAFGASQLGPAARMNAWRWTSALGWAVSTVAYPTLGAALALFLFGVALSPAMTRRASYAGLTLGLQALAWSAVVIVLGWDRLAGSYSYLAQANAVGDWSRKLRFTRSLFDQHPVFACECIFALALGVFGRAVGALAVGFVTALMGLACLVLQPALFAPSHDLVLLLALSGLHTLAGFRRDADPAERLLALLYLAGLAAGAVTTLTAYNSLYNFAVGGAAAAVLAMVGPPSDLKIGRASLLLRAVVVTGALIAIVMTHSYGDRPGDPAPRVRVASGPYAGLWGQSRQVQTLELVGRSIAPLLGKPGSTVVQAGIAPGLIMQTRARPLMLAVYPLSPATPAAVRRTTLLFHERRPADWVMIYRDPYFDPPNPFGARFPERYRLVRRDEAALGSIELFQLKSAGR